MRPLKITSLHTQYFTAQRKMGKITRSRLRYLNNVKLINNT
jgi:hypothetical protein